MIPAVEFSLPNVLSASRVALVPFLVASLRRDSLDSADGAGGVSWLTGILVIAAAASDFLDGYLARRLGSVSRFGKILDPLADKVSVAAVGVTLVLYFGFPLWLLGLQLARDAAIVGVGLLLWRRRGIVTSASGLGKLATGSMVAALIAFVLAIPVAVADGAVALATSFLILSSLDYLRRAHRVFNTGEEGGPERWRPTDDPAQNP